MKSKIVFLVGIALMSSVISHAQTDTSKVELYCQLISTQRILSNKVTIEIDLGEEKLFWRDNRLTTLDGKIRKFNTIIDAMNYMGMSGWVFINAYPVRMGDTEIYHFAFKKLFARPELNYKTEILKPF